MHFVKRLLGLFLPYKIQSMLLIFALLIDLAVDTLLPLSFKFVIDYAIVPQNHGNLVMILALLVSGATLASLTGVYREKLYATMSSSINRDLHLTLFAQLQRLSMDFFARTKAGDILARFNTDLSSVNNLILLLPYGVLSFIGLIVNVCILFILQWKLAIFAVIGLPLCLIGPKRLGKRAAESSYQVKEEQAEVTAIVQENIMAQPVIKAFGLEKSMLSRFSAKMLRFLKVSATANFYTFLIDRTTNIGILVLHLIAVCIGSVLAFQGHLSLGSLLAFNSLLISISHLITAVTWMAPQVVDAMAGLKRIDELLDEMPSIADKQEAATAQAVPVAEPAGIQFVDVCFRYSPEQRGLTDVNLFIPQGHFVAFVGGSGSGKSTMINLLMRFYEPISGSIFVNGVDYRNIRLETLRAQIGIVFQENMLFDTSIRENIRMGNPDASDAEIEEAAKAAEIHDFILTLPDAYETRVGERGSRLSGGQRQRIAIARALVRNPAILVLDEATSALDPATEEAINKTIERIQGSRTIISVTHRLASVERADHIYVLDQGNLVERGTHGQLLAIENGFYKHSWQKQSGFSFSDDGFTAEIKPERLLAIPLLAKLDTSFLTEISQYFVTESYGKNRIVLEEGEPGDKFYMIVRGKVEVLKSRGTNEQEQVAVLSDGDFFGEIALLHDVPRSATIRTVTPVVLITLQRGLFQRLLHKAPHLRELLMNRELK
ncbi:MAG: ABC transporter transmembrane domain-containing protein [Clostridia bacterium]